MNHKSRERSARLWRVQRRGTGLPKLPPAEVKARVLEMSSNVRWVAARSIAYDARVRRTQAVAALKTLHAEGLMLYDDDGRWRKA